MSESLTFVSHIAISSANKIDVGLGLSVGIGIVDTIIFRTFGSHDVNGERNCALRNRKTLLRLL